MKFRLQHAILIKKREKDGTAHGRKRFSDLSDAGGDRKSDPHSRKALSYPTGSEQAAAEYGVGTGCAAVSAQQTRRDPDPCGRGRPGEHPENGDGTGIPPQPHPAQQGRRERHPADGSLPRLLQLPPAQDPCRLYGAVSERHPESVQQPQPRQYAQAAGRAGLSRHRPGRVRLARRQDPAGAGGGLPDPEQSQRQHPAGSDAVHRPRLQPRTHEHESPLADGARSRADQCPECGRSGGLCLHGAGRPWLEHRAGDLPLLF